MSWEISASPSNFHWTYVPWWTFRIFLPITSFDGPLLGFKKPRSRGKDEKLRQEKAKMRKKTKHQVRGVFWVISYYKTG